MKRNTTIVALILFFIAPQFSSAQEYFGTWTLDWSKVLKSEDNNPMFRDSLQRFQVVNDNNPVWIISDDSLKVFQNGSLISAAGIVWMRKNKFEIIDNQRKKNPVHFIDDLDDGLIKMTTGYSDAEIYLRRL